MQTQPSASNASVLNGGRSDFHDSGVSWGAVFAGAAVAAALSMILLILGFGLGLSSVSPWTYSAAAIGISTIAWLAFMQLVASGVGGYIAGRLRVKWANVHTDEVFFRDTAHGLLTWAVASLITAALLTTTVHAILGGAVQAGNGMASIAGSKMGGDPSQRSDHGESRGDNPADYFSDMLLRSDANGDGNLGGPGLHGEVNKILITDLAAGTMPREDHDYLAKLVAKRSGMSSSEADAKVDDVYTRATKAKTDTEAVVKDTAEKAREAAAYSALWMFVALLLGAFVASLAATFGGRLRDADHLHIRN